MNVTFEFQDCSLSLRCPDLIVVDLINFGLKFWLFYNLSAASSSALVSVVDDKLVDIL